MKFECYQFDMQCFATYFHPLIPASGEDRYPIEDFPAGGDVVRHKVVAEYSDKSCVGLETVIPEFDEQSEANIRDDSFSELN